MAEINAENGHYKITTAEIVEAVTDAGIVINSKKLLPKTNYHLRLGDSSHILYNIYALYTNFRQLTGESSGTDLAIRTYGSTSRHMLMQSYDGAYKTCLDLVNGRVDIPLAGDISVLVDKVVGVGVGVLGLPLADRGLVSDFPGSVYFDQVTGKLWIYNGSAWISVTLS